MTRINLEQFSDCMEALCNYLDGWDSYFGGMIETTAQMDAEASADFYGGFEP